MFVPPDSSELLARRFHQLRRWSGVDHGIDLIVAERHGNRAVGRSLMVQLFPIRFPSHNAVLCAHHPWSCRKMFRSAPLARDTARLVIPAHWHSSSSVKMALKATPLRMVNFCMLKLSAHKDSAPSADLNPRATPPASFALYLRYQDRHDRLLQA